MWNVTAWNVIHVMMNAQENLRLRKRNLFPLACYIANDQENNYSIA